MIHTTDTEWTFWEYLFTTKLGIGWIPPGLGYITGDILIVVLTLIVICSLSAVRASGYFQVRSIDVSWTFLPTKKVALIIYHSTMTCFIVKFCVCVAPFHSHFPQKKRSETKYQCKSPDCCKNLTLLFCFFQVFYWSHFLYWIFFVFLLLHGPIFWCFFLVPGLLFIAEKLFSIIIFFKQMGSSKCYIEEVNLLPSKVCMIQSNIYDTMSHKWKRWKM